MNLSLNPIVVICEMRYEENDRTESGGGNADRQFEKAYAEIARVLVWMK